MDWIESMCGKPPLSLALRALTTVLTALIFLVVSSPIQAAAPSVEMVRVQTHQGFTRIVLETNAPIEPNLFTMGGPDRLVIDLPELLWRIPRPSGYVDSPLIRKYSFGLFQPGVSRLVLDLSGPTQILRKNLSRGASGFSYQIDLANLTPAGAPELTKRAPTQFPVAQRPLPDALPKPYIDPVQGLPAASTVDPATKSVFRARNFDPDRAQFDLLNAAIRETSGASEPTQASQPERAAHSDIVVVPADAPEYLEIAAPIESLPSQPILPVDPIPQSLDALPPFNPSVAKPIRPFSSIITDKPARTPKLAAPVFELATKVETLPPLPPAPRLPALLPEPEDKAKLLPEEKKKASKPEVAAEIEKMKPKKSSRRPTRVVLDPGHGGRDPGTGAEGEVQEKDINLKFAITLANLLEDDPNFEVFLTREQDIRVKLPKRVKFARRKDADLFISIHADWSFNKYAKGATAYTLSEEASVEELDKLANEKDEAGKIAGVDLAAEREDVARLLVDLARRETQARSVKFAEIVVKEVAKETPVLRRPLREDNFHVLKAPDMPSVLLELGFLSNELDRERLQSAAWRLKTAKAVKRAIEEFRRVTGSRDFANR